MIIFHFYLKLIIIRMKYKEQTSKLIRADIILMYLKKIL